jgi:hypothetical protein
LLLFIRNKKGTIPIPGCDLGKGGVYMENPPPLPQYMGDRTLVLRENMKKGNRKRGEM